MTRTEQRLAVALAASLLACTAMAAALVGPQHPQAAGHAAPSAVVAGVASLDPSLPSASEVLAGQDELPAEPAPTF